MIQDSGFRVQLVEVFYHDVAKMPDDSIIHSIKKSYDVLLDLLLTFFYVHLGSGSGFRIQEPVRGITPRPLGEVTLLTVVVCTVSCHCEDSFVFFRHGLSEGGETLLAQA